MRGIVIVLVIACSLTDAVIGQDADEKCQQEMMEFTKNSICSADEDVKLASRTCVESKMNPEEDKEILEILEQSSWSPAAWDQLCSDTTVIPEMKKRLEQKGTPWKPCECKEKLKACMNDE